MSYRKVSDFLVIIQKVTNIDPRELIGKDGPE